MTDPATKAVSLPIVAWSYIPSDAWRDRVLTDDAEKAEIALGFGREITALTPHAPAQAEIDRLRADNGQWIEETVRLREALEVIADQGSGNVCSANLADCMAAIARAALTAGKAPL